MLHFCSIDDITAIVPSAERYAAGFEIIRQAITDKFNIYLRRRLDFESGIVEYFDTREICIGEKTNFWLRKRQIAPSSLAVLVQYQRDWTDTAAVVTSDNYILDAELGKLTLWGPMLKRPNAIRLTYDAGWIESDTPGVMACDPLLKLSAVKQAVFIIDELSSRDQNTQQRSSKSQGLFNKRKLVDGLLPEVAGVLGNYRRPLGK